jgi:class 3 adenylate cyclase/tetratricopeptide (TPR) repeat protein
MELQEQLDAEVWAGIMGRFVAILAEGVRKYGGTVDKFTGDGIMALFGAPVAQEDHARRACNAAWHLTEAIGEYSDELKQERGIELQVRLGLNSGEVVVGRICDNVTLDSTALGHTVGLAQRMEALAAPGSAYMTKATAVQVAGYFVLRDHGAMQVKGAHEQVSVFELIGPGPLRTPLEVAAARGFSRFVGRDREMAVLDAALAEAAKGDGRVIGVVAEPGVGKSRLCHEFAERCRATGVDVFAAHAFAHARSVPFVPVLEMLRGQFQITDQDDPAIARAKIAAAIADLDPGVEDVLPFLYEFLGVADPQAPAPAIDAEARQRQLFAALNRLRRARADRNPYVLLVEDLHWLDSGSEAFLDNLVNTVPATAVLVVTTFRPEYRAPWANRAHYAQLPLGPLADQATEDLLRSLLGTHPSLDGLAQLVRQRTGGNPFYIEEVVHGLVEQGALDGDRGDYRLARDFDDIRIPPTVTAVLAARVDSLSANDKAVVQTAAVIGRHFSRPLLSRIVGFADRDLDASLRGLLQAELVYETSSYPEQEYAFKHALVEEVAYSSQLSKRRGSLHVAVARALEELEADRLDERAALIAHHYEQGAELLDAARWNARAAVWAGWLQPLEAARCWRRVCALTSHLDASPDTEALAMNAHLQLLLTMSRLGAASEEGSRRYEEEAGEVFAQAQRFAEAAGQPPIQVLALLAYGALRQLTDAIEEGHDLHARATRLSDEIGDPALRVAARHPHAWALCVLGRVREAAAITQEMIDIIGEDRSIGRGLTVVSPYAWCRSFQALFRAYFDRVDTALVTLDRMIDLEAEEEDWEGRAWAYRNWAIVADLAGADPDRAVVRARRGLHWAEEAGGPWSRIFVRDGVAIAYAHQGDWQAALDTIDEALAIATSYRLALADVALLMATRARALRGRGDLDAARTSAADAVGAAARCGARLYEIPARLEHARAMIGDLRPGDAALVRAELDRASSLVETLGIGTYAPQLNLAQALLADATGDVHAHHAELVEAHRLFVAIGADGRAAEVAAMMASASSGGVAH